MVVHCFSPSECRPYLPWSAFMFLRQIPQQLVDARAAQASTRSGFHSCVRLFALPTLDFCNPQ